jgi:AbrB family looped-hinge helix DNA binding protein
METKKDHKKTFYGTTTIGEKGQVVIPVQAREAMKLKKGEKLLVFGFGREMLALSKLVHIERFASHLAQRLSIIQKIIKKTA